MAKRAYNYRTITTTNTAQPVVGTKTTAAVAINTTGPSVVPVADTTIFDLGQYAVIDTTVALGGGGEERMLVIAISAGVSITLQTPGNSGCKIAHANAVFIRPGRVVSTMKVQALDGNAGPLYICTGPNGTTAGVACTDKLQNVSAGQQPVEFTDYFPGDSGANPIDLSEYWIVGTAGDSYLPSFGAV